MSNEPKGVEELDEAGRLLYSLEWWDTLVDVKELHDKIAQALAAARFRAEAERDEARAELAELRRKIEEKS